MKLTLKERQSRISEGLKLYWKRRKSGESHTRHANSRAADLCVCGHVRDSHDATGKCRIDGCACGPGCIHDGFVRADGVVEMYNGETAKEREARWKQEESVRKERDQAVLLLPALTAEIKNLKEQLANEHAFSEGYQEHIGDLLDAMRPFVLLVTETSGRIPVERLSFANWHSLSKAFKAAVTALNITNDPNALPAVSRLRRQRDDLLSACMATAAIVQDEPCRADHHGLCQAHNLEPVEKCWAKLVKEAVANGRNSQ